MRLVYASISRKYVTRSIFQAHFAIDESSVLKHYNIFMALNLRMGFPIYDIFFFIFFSYFFCAQNQHILIAENDIEISVATIVNFLRINL